jgi:hypothetical protein
MHFFLFLGIFFLLYGALHFCVLWKAHRAYPSLGLHRWGLFWLVLCGILVATPVLVRLLEHAELDSIARPLAWTAYTWMGLLFLFASLLLVLEVLGGAARLVRRRARTVALHRFQFWLALGGAVVVVLHGMQSARQPVLEEISLFSPKIPQEIGEIRIVQLSDLHLGLMLGEERLRPILDLVRQARPDLLLATGDIVDGQMGHLDGLSDLFAALAAPLGKFAILGNHEMYVGVEHSMDFLAESGFTVLRNEIHNLAGILTLVGIDDIVIPSDREHSVVERELLHSLAADSYVVYLKHRPLLPAGGGAGFDLQLSGHTHQGQIFPFLLLTRLAFPHPAGLVRFPGGGLLYTNRGGGTWGPPMRFLAPPEVTLIRLRHREGDLP